MQKTKHTMPESRKRLLLLLAACAAAWAFDFATLCNHFGFVAFGFLWSYAIFIEPLVLFPLLAYFLSCFNPKLAAIRLSALAVFGTLMLEVPIEMALRL